MIIHRFSLPRPALALAGLLTLAVGLGLASPASAGLEPTPDGDRTCLQECHGQRRHCVHACRTSVYTCLRSAKAETRLCRRTCIAQYEADTLERDTCLTDCRHDVLAPAADECRALGVDCAPQCLPGRCRALCGPDGGGLDDMDECRAGCAGELRACAKDIRQEMRTCLAPCREFDDPADRETCAQPCFEAARISTADCQEDLQTCSASCEDSTTTTTLVD